MIMVSERWRDWGSELCTTTPQISGLETPHSIPEIIVLSLLKFQLRQKLHTERCKLVNV